MKHLQPIGRKEQVKAFRGLLESGVENWVLTIVGDSGLGKSYLLEYLRDFETKDEYPRVWIDFTNARLRTDPLALLNYLGEMLRSSMSQRAWQDFKTTLREEEAALARRVESFNIHQEIVSSEGAKISDIVQSVEVGSLLRAAVDRTRSVVTGALLDALETIESPRVLFFLDSFELVQRASDSFFMDWLLDELLIFSYRRLDKNLRVLICSRRSITKGLITASTEESRLHKLDLREHNLVLQSSGISEELGKEFYVLTQGHPLLTSVLARLWQEDVKDWKTIDLQSVHHSLNISARSEWLIGRVMQRLSMPISDLFRYGVILRRFDFNILQAVFPDLLEGEETVFCELISYPFVRPLPNGFFTFHELIRSVQEHYLRYHMSAAFEKYHRRALTYYEDLSQEQEYKLSQPIYPVQYEILYHLTAVDEKEGLGQFRSLFRTAIRCHDLPKANVLLEEMQSYDWLHQETEDWLQYHKALLQYLSDEWDSAYEGFLKLWDRQNVDTNLRALVSESLADLSFEQGRSHTALEYYLEGVKVYETQGDRIRLAHLQANIGGKIYRALGDWPRAIEILEDSLAILESEKEITGVARAALQLGNIWRLSGCWDKAVRLCKRSVELYQDMKNDYRAAVALFTLGRTQMQRGDLAAAESTNLRAIGLLEKLDSPYRHGIALRNLADVYRFQKRLDAAEDAYRHSLTLFEKIGARQQWAIAVGNLGSLYCEKGMIRQAQEHYERSLKTKKELGDDYGVAVTSCDLGNLLQRQKQWKEAISHYKDALKILLEHPAAKIQTNALIGLCRSHLALGHRGEDIITLANEAIQVAQEAELLEEIAELYSIVASIRLACGEFGEATESLKRALETVALLGEGFQVKPIKEIIIDGLTSVPECNKVKACQTVERLREKYLKNAPSETISQVSDALEDWLNEQ
jgi:tetratricopeptide (TPR) repeat protein